MQSTKTLTLAAPKLDFSEFLKDLEALICFFLISIEYMFEKSLTAWVSLDESPFKYVDVDCFVFYFV